MANRFMKYNPSFLTEDELIENFVVRHADLEMIIRIIRDNVTDSNQHVLVIGPRGSGKTTLALRVAAEIERNEKLSSRWYPLIFSEESYEVVSAGEFWLEAMFHLSEQTDDPKCGRTYSELKNEANDQRLAERALGQLMDFADSQGKKILLVVENLNMLFSDLKSEDEAWKLRHTLINEPRLMMLATATTKFENPDDLETLRKMSSKIEPIAKSRFVKLGNDSRAMYELFKMHELIPLNDDECNAVWELITGQKLTGKQIRPIRILTGGNPRLITIIAKFGAHRSFRQLLDDLIDLVDDHTEYFKSQLESLPAIERKVYLSLAGLWDTSTARDIAKAARLDVNKTSSLLNRLISRGFIVVEMEGKRTKFYRIAERMYNIYYLMRRRGKPSDRVKAAVKFMVSMYDPESAARLITEEACRLSPELCRDHYLAYEETIKAVPNRQLLEKIITTTPKSFLDSPYLSEALKNVIDVDKRTVTQEEASGEVDTELQEAREIIEQGVKLGKDRNYEQALKIFDELITKFKSSNKRDLIVEVAEAMVYKGVSLGELKRTEEAIRICDEVITMYKDSLEPLFAEKVAGAMLYKGVSLGTLNRTEEAIRAYDDVVAIYKDRPESLSDEQVAMVMFYKGVSLGILNRTEEAIRVYDEVVAIYKGRPEPEIVEQVTSALVNKGASLGALNRMEEEIQVYDEVVDIYKNRPEPQIAEKVVSAMVNKGVSLGALNRSEEAIRVYDEVTAIYKDRSEPQIVEKVAMAMVNKGIRLGTLNCTDEATQIYDEVVARYKARPEVQIAEQVARAMGHKGLSLGALNRTDEAIQVYDEVAALYKDRPEAQIVEPVAMAIFNKGVSLGALNRTNEAIQAYDEVEALYKDRPEAQIAAKVAKAMVNKGISLGTLKRTDEEIRVYDEVAVRYKDRPEAQIVELVARAMVNKGVSLEMLGRYEEAEKALLNAIELRPDLTAAYIALIELLLKIPARHNDALKTAEEIISRNPEDSNLLNGISWAFYEHRNLSLLRKAEKWARQAVSISPDDSIICHTLACILSALGKGDQALESAKRYIQDTALVEKSIDDSIELFVELAASGNAKKALEILVNSPAEKHLEPLVVGLKLYIGEDVKTAVEILEVAKDVVKRIEERGGRRDRASNDLC